MDQNPPTPQRRLDGGTVSSYFEEVECEYVIRDTKDSNTLDEAETVDPNVVREVLAARAIHSTEESDRSEVSR